MKRTGIAVIATMTALTLAGCDLEEAASGGGSSDSPVTYRIKGGSGVSTVSVTYTDGGTSTSQDNGTAVPWEKEVEPADSVIVYQVSAQNQGDSGTIKCEIEIDGEIVAENTSQGEYAIVSCDHTP